MLRPALRVVNRDAGVLAFDNTGQRLIEAEVSGQRENVRAGDHDFANRNAVQFNGVVNHLFLKFRNLSELAAGGNNQLEFVG